MAHHPSWLKIVLLKRNNWLCISQALDKERLEKRIESGEWDICKQEILDRIRWQNHLEVMLDRAYENRDFDSSVVRTNLRGFLDDQDCSF